MDRLFDGICIGSGLGSLSLAALLTKKGHDILVLEKAKECGGCASSYSKSGYRFEAGATTLVGWEKDLPLERLFLALDIFPMEEIPLEHGERLIRYDGLEIIRLNPAMRIHMPAGINLIRSEDKEDWIETCIDNFGEPSSQRRFWKTVFFLNENVWNTSRRMSHFPPVQFRDYFHCLKNFHPRDILLLLGSFFSVQNLLSLPGFPKSKAFRKFLDEQLLITVQTTAEGSPLSMGAAGISYAHLQNTYVMGGIGELAGFLVEWIRKNGGTVLNQEEVESISGLESSDNDFISPTIKINTNYYFRVKTRKDHIFNARSLYAGIPIWNLDRMLSRNFQDLNNVSTKYKKELLVWKKEVNRRSQAFEKEIWGAFNLSIAIPNFLEDGDAIHHQFHLPHSLPYGGGDSIFISTSHKWDSKRTISGMEKDHPVNHQIDAKRNYSPVLILAVSTHVKSPESWDRKDPDYKKKKEEIQNIILDHLEKNWKGFRKKDILSIQSATPATWQTWTGRYAGRVGGLPGSYFRNPFRFPSSQSRMRGFYYLGDTVYPGQGIPAVVLGALNLVSRLNLD